MKSEIIESDVVKWQTTRKLHEDTYDTEGRTLSNNDTLQYVGGVDISFVKSDSEKACVALVILEIPSLKVTKPFV